MVTEAHDTHHPVGAGLSCEDQKPEALRRAGEFCRHRIPKFLGWFETVLTRNSAGPDISWAGDWAMPICRCSNSSKDCGMPSHGPRQAARRRCEAPALDTALHHQYLAGSSPTA
jgi:glutathione S-transferase